MKKTTCFILAAMMCVALLPVLGLAADAEIYVAVNGKDINDGTINSPLATFVEAKNRVAALKKQRPNEPITVYFRGGEYHATQSVDFGAEDSGTADGIVTYKAYQNEEVLFTGDVTVDAKQLKPVSKEIKERLPEQARNQVGVLDLSAQGIKQIPEYTYDHTKLAYHPWGAFTLNAGAFLYVDGAEQDVAGWPNAKYAKIEKAIQGNSSQPISFSTSNPRIEYWAGAPDAYLEGLFYYEYRFEMVKVGASNAAEKSITSANKVAYGCKAGGHWRIINVLEEIDVPGEYYIDKKNLLLYYYPEHNLKNAKMSISLLNEPFITMTNTSYISVEGLGFQRSVGDGIIMQDSSNITIAGCKFTDIASVGISAKKCKNITVTSSDFVRVGAYSVNVSGGDIQTLEPANNIVKNNEIYDFVGKQKNTRAIYLSGVGCEARNNTLHTSPYQAINFWGNDHKIMNNEIYDAIKETLDCGTIYGGRSWVHRGTEIAYNYIHNVYSNIAGGNVIGIYLDDQMSGINVHHNVTDNVTKAALIGGGRDVIYTDNIIANCATAMTFDNRGEGWQASSAAPGGAVYGTLNTVKYNEPPYSIRYPEVVNIPTQQPGVPVGMVYKDNIEYNAPVKSSIASSAIKNAKEYKANTVVAASEGAFEKIIAEKGIDLTKTGIYIDEFRKTKKHPWNEFRLICPRNGAMGIDNTEQYFKWDAADWADEYEIAFATDPDMKNVVKKLRVRYNEAMVTGLETGLQKFYWNVTAIRRAGGKEETYVSAGTPFLFQTTQYDITKKAELEKVLGYAQTVSDGIVEGSGGGEYAVGSKALLKGEIDKAKLVFDSLTSYQKDIDAMVIQLTEAIVKVGKLTNVYYTDIADMTASYDNWQGNNGEVEDGTATLKSGGNNQISYIKESVPTDKVMCLKANLDNWGSWIPFSFKQNKPAVLPYGKGMNSYFIVVKADVIELQERANGVGGVLTSVINTHIREGEWHDLQLGAIKCGNAVRLIMGVDGERIFDYFDYINPYLGEGYLTMAAVDAQQTTSLRNADAIPEPELADISEGNGGTGLKIEYADFASFLKDESGWSGQTAVSEGTAEIKDTYNLYGESVKANLAYQFSAKLSLDSGYQGIVFRQKDKNTKLTGGGTGYMLKLSKGYISLIKYKNGKHEYLSITKNDAILTDGWNDIDIVNSRSGGALELKIAINGKSVISYSDTEAIFTGGYFGLCSDTPMDIQIKAAQ